MRAHLPLQLAFAFLALTGHKAADAFRTEPLLATSRRSEPLTTTARLRRELRHSRELSRHLLQTIILKQERPSSCDSTDRRPCTKSQFPPHKKRRRKYRGNRSNVATRSRAVLNSFEEVCQRERRDRSLHREEFIDLLNSMVQDVLDGKNIPVDQNDTKGGNRPNLSYHILPRDASSLIRLLGRHIAHDAMLQFCRRYCRDIMNASKASKNGNRSKSRLDAEEAILFAYTAAIAACSKPPPTSLTSSTEPHVATNSTYRSKSFLLSLLNEMEHDYAEDGRSIRPNSYTLSAVLLGIDDAMEASNVLKEFEDKYQKRHDDVEGEDGQQSGNIVTVQVYNVVVASCSKKTSDNGSGWQRSLSILQRMRRSGPQPNEQTYSLILQACADCGQVKVAMSIVDEIRQSPLSKTVKLYLPLLKVCAKLGDSKMAMSLINIMKEDDMELTTEIMNLYLSALATSSMHVRALGVLYEMIADPSLTPDIVTFNTVLSACANADDYEGAQALLDQMKEGMFAFPANGQNNLVEIGPDVVSYNTVISCADPDSALSLIQEMRLTRRNREGVVSPNAITYVNAISQCRKASLKEDDQGCAFEIFEIAMYLLGLARDDNRGEGVDLNVFVYSSAIWMAEAVGDCQTAVQLLREMKCSPNAICYNGVISVFSSQGLYREALYFYYEMQHLGLSATRKTYQRLVFALDNAKDPELSCQKKIALLDGVLSVMDEKDRCVGKGGPLFESLIRNHNNATDPDTSYQAARTAFDSIIGPVDDACLSSMLRVCSSANPVKWNEALMLIHSSDIVNKAYGPGLVSRRALSYAVISCSKADQWEEALNLIDVYGHQVNVNGSTGKSTQSGVVSVAAINSIIRACGRSSRPDIAVQLLNDMPVKYGVLADERSYRLAIIACNQAEHRETKMRCHNSLDDPENTIRLKWWECALSLLRRMREDEIKPSLQTFSSAVSACEAAGQWQRAIGVLQLMPAFSPLLGHNKMEEIDTHEPANLYCLNAAISACEKGGAWVEALQLYENARSLQDTKPNFITVNSLLIALERANQLELAESIYKDALRDNVVSPWKRRYDNDGKLRNMMDLHKFSAPLAKIAVRSYMGFLLSPRRRKFPTSDAVFIVGKGKRSEEMPVLIPTILQLFRDEFGIEATIDKKNKGRIRVAKESIENIIESKKWKV